MLDEPRPVAPLLVQAPTFRPQGVAIGSGGFNPSLVSLATSPHTFSAATCARGADTAAEKAWLLYGTRVNVTRWSGLGVPSCVFVALAVVLLSVPVLTPAVQGQVAIPFASSPNACLGPGAVVNFNTRNWYTGYGAPGFPFGTSTASVLAERRDECRHRLSDPRRWRNVVLRGRSGHPAVEASPEREASPAAKDAIKQILVNSRMCAQGHRPICQDTGIVTVFAASA